MCFLVSITWLGVITALINDLAGHFGCSIGLEDAVTAISLVALGTSLPGQSNLLRVFEIGAGWGMKLNYVQIFAALQGTF